MADPVQVEIQVSVRHRDKDFSNVGTGGQASCVVELEDFDVFAEKLWKETVTKVGERYTRSKKRRWVAKHWSEVIFGIIHQRMGIHLKAVEDRPIPDCFNPETMTQAEQQEVPGE